jgi:DNA replication regulator SLD3
LYVIERVKRGIYALCSLASWVGEGELQVASKGRQIPLDTTSKSEIYDSCTETKDWRELAGLDAKLFEQDATLNEKIKTLNVSLAFGPCISPDFNVSTIEYKSVSDQAALSTLPELVLPASGNSLDQHCETPEAAQTVDEILDSLREQYLETLYVSKVSQSVI